MDSQADISKIIGLIMENPDIIERIKSLAKSDGESNKTSQSENDNDDSLINNSGTEENTVYKENQNEEYTETSDYASSRGEPTYNKKRFNKKKRSELLCALKPYISKERCKAIDTMLSVFDIFEIMKER